MTEYAIFFIYLLGIPALLGFMAMIDRHSVTEAFWGCVLWPITLVGVIVFIVFYQPMVRRAKERARND